jgi:hypothetical protein
MNVAAGIARSVQRLLTVRGSNPVGFRFYGHIQTGSEAHLASCTMGTRSLSRG